MGIHPTEGESKHELYLMSDDVEKTIATLASKAVSCSPVVDAGWGLLTNVALPDGGTIGLYQPRHPTPIKAASS
jgi:hypothetical protein